MSRVFRVLVLCVILGLLSTAAFAANIKIDPFEVTDHTGVKLYLARYQAEGTAPAKSILLVHGLTYSSHEFDVDYGDYSLARFLANNGYAVWLLDIAGYGQSRDTSGNASWTGLIPNSDYAAENIKSAVDKIRDETGAAKVDVLGWSWGTVTAGRFAAKYPDLVNNLILYAPIITGLGGIFGNVTAEYTYPIWWGAAEDFQPQPFEGVIDYDITERPVADLFIANCWRYDGAGSPNGGRKDLFETAGSLIPLDGIKAPTLLIAGSEDPYLNGAFYSSPDDLTEEASSMSNATAKVIEGAAHPMMMEKPYYKEFRNSVLGFLTTGDPDSVNEKDGGGGCDAGSGSGVLLLGAVIAAALRKRKAA